MRGSAVVAAILPLSLPFAAELSPGASPRGSERVAAVADLPVIAANSNRKAAGRMERGTLVLDLTVVRGKWHPENDDGPHLEVLAFAERGGQPSIPGPLIRVPVGTRIRVTLRNPLSADLSVIGLTERPAPTTPVRIAPGARHTFEFTANAVGTYGYRAFVGSGEGQDFADGSQLNGALIVDDPADVRPDRVFVIGVRFRAKDSTTAGVTPEQITMVINGRSWPHTERLELTEGDSVRWRIVNLSLDPHPMHLHGFYFRVDSRGAWNADTVYTPAQQRLAVTELMYPGSTFTMSFSPTEAGNWIFHCHFAFHVGPHVAMASAVATNGAQHAHAGNRHMSGLVLGMHVKGRGEPPQRGDPSRTVNLFVQSEPRRFKDRPGYAFLVQAGENEPRADSVPRMSSTLVLTRGERVRINVVNRLADPTAIHWHGIELESFPDGVPHFSGMPDNLFTHVPARDSFSAIFTPPRAGTFIYHSHLDEMDQIMSGLFGPLIVLEPGERLDPEHDRIFVVGGAGPPPADFEEPQKGTINGEADPSAMSLVVGQSYRFRLININPDWRVELTLGSDTALVQWRPVAKDGADLPEHQRTARAAYLLTGPGETADFEFTPTEPGFLRLVAKTRNPGWHTRVNIRVRPAD